MRGEKARVLEIVGDWCESLHVCARFCKIVEEEGFKCKEIQGMNLNPRKLYLMFGLKKKPYSIHGFCLWLV